MWCLFFFPYEVGQASQSLLPQNVPCGTSSVKQAAFSFSNSFWAEMQKFFPSGIIYAGLTSPSDHRLIWLDVAPMSSCLFFWSWKPELQRGEMYYSHYLFLTLMIISSTQEKKFSSSINMKAFSSVSEIQQLSCPLSPTLSCFHCLLECLRFLRLLVFSFSHLSLT